MDRAQIKAALKTRRITNREFAAKLGVGETTTSRWLNGKRNPSKAAQIALELVYKMHFENQAIVHEGQVIYSPLP